MSKPLQVSLTPLLKIFSDKDIRIYGTIENPLFILTDIGKYLGDLSPTKTIHVFDEWDGYVTKIFIQDRLNRTQEAFALTEQGIYGYITLSIKRPNAKELNNWIHNIICSLRKNGKIETDEDEHKKLTDIMKNKISHKDFVKSMDNAKEDLKECLAEYKYLEKMSNCFKTRSDLYTYAIKRWVYLKGSKIFPIDVTISHLDTNVTNKEIPKPPRHYDENIRKWVEDEPEEEVDFTLAGHKFVYSLSELYFEKGWYNYYYNLVEQYLNEKFQDILE